METMTPPVPWRTMCQAASREHRKTPVRSTSMTACHLASDSFSTSSPFLRTRKPSRLRPALLTTASMPPACSTNAANSASTLASSATSAVRVQIGCSRPAAASRLGQPGGVDVAHADARSGRGQVQGEDAAQTARPAGDQDPRSRDLHLGSSLTW